MHDNIESSSVKHAVAAQAVFSGIDYYMRPDKRFDPVCLLFGVGYYYLDSGAALLLRSPAGAVVGMYARPVAAGLLGVGTKMATRAAAGTFNLGTEFSLSGPVVTGHLVAALSGVAASWAGDMLKW